MNETFEQNSQSQENNGADTAPAVQPVSLPEYLQQLPADAIDRLGELIKSSLDQMPAGNIRTTIAGRNGNVRVSPYATALHQLLTAVENELREVWQE